MDEQKKHKTSFWKIIKRTLLVLFVVFVLIILFVRSPWGQDIIVSKATSYISDRTNTKVEIEKLYLTFSGNILLNGLYLEDKKADTLVYSKSLEASVAILPLIRGKAFNLKSLEWQGLKANVYRKDTISKFNYQFLIDALVPKDTTTVQSNTEPMEINLGKLSLKDFEVSYNDAVLGIESNLKFNEFGLVTNSIDINTMQFDIDQIDLNTASINYQQTKPFVSEETTATTKLPSIALQNININNTKVNYGTTPDNLAIALFLNELNVALPKLDLENQEVILTNLEVLNSDISYQQINTKVTLEAKTTTKTKFEWPNWKVNAENIVVSKNNIQAKTGNTPNTKGVFNAENLDFKNLDFKVNTLDYQPNKASVIIDDISFMERSGFQLKKFATQIKFNNSNTELKNLVLQTNNNSVSGDLSIAYKSINTVIQQPDSTVFSIAVPNLSINPKDAYYFSPQLKKNAAITALAKKPLTGSLNLNGNLSEITIPKTKLNWGESTNLTVEGLVKNPTNIDALFLDLNTINFSSNKKDITNFVDKETVTVNFPEKINLKGNIKGDLNDIKTDALLTTSLGNVNVKGNFKNKNNIAFNGVIVIDDLNAQKILKNEKLGTYSLTTTIKGEGNSLNNLDATLKTDIKELSYNKYDLSALQFNGKITNGEGKVNLGFKDENLDFDFVNTISLDSVASKITSDLALNGIDFKSLGVTKDDIRAKFNLNTVVEGNSIDNLEFKGEFNDILTVREDRPYVLGAIKFDGALTEKTTTFNLESNPINASLVSNTDVNNLTTAIQNKLTGYFSENTIANDTIASDTKMEFKAELKQASILKNVLVPALESFEPMVINVDFDAAKNSFIANAKAPMIVYDGNEIDSLNFSLNAIKEDFNFDLNLSALETGVIAVQKISLQGDLRDKILYSNFKAYDKEEVLVKLGTEIYGKNDSITIHVDSEKLILNKQNWSIPPTNKITFAPRYLGVTNFQLSQNEQQITISNVLPNKAMEHLGFNFKDFELSTITSIFNQEKLIASGTLNGDFIIEYPFDDAGISANATIRQLKTLEVPLGTLELKAKSSGNSKYNLGLKIFGDNMNMDITGDYTANRNGAPINFDIDLKNLQLKPFEEMASTYISEPSGSLSAKLKLTGTTTDPDIFGNLNFNKAKVTVNAFNASFTLPDEAIKLDDNGVYFNSFTMLDANENPFVLDGSVGTKELTNPTFDLTLKAKNMELLNSTKKDNDLFYGKMNLNTNLTIQGNLVLPKVRGSMVVNNSSDFTYVISETKADVVEKAGVVLFVNKENPDDILTKQKEDVSSNAVLKGYDINATVSVAEKAKFNIIIDERSGDNLQVSGTGDFKFGIAENGNMSLVGKYEVADGHYEASLYGIVKRRFDIASGSTVTWRGNPLEADLDIKAVYEVETAASGLMASQLTGESESVSSQYRQELPFLVYLNLNGELLKPQISFNLDIPKESQGELGGAVYSQVQQLNTDDDELNKQVFSLLVFNQFFPTSTSDGSSGGSLSIARDNANSVLSNQLNKFSNKVFGKSGIELDFGIDSYTDYTGETETNKTTLDINARKKLLNDRLIVEVGSGVDIQENNDNAGETTPLIGTVNIQYLFDENGTWRIKAYRKNDFENVIDGQIILTGLSLIFNKEFNKFKELFAEKVKKEVDKTKKEKKVKATEEEKEEEKAKEENEK